MGYIPPPPPGQNAGFYETNSLPPPISEPVPDERPLPYDRDLLMTVNERAVMQLFWLVGFVGMLVGIVTGEILLDVLSAIALAAAIWLSREPTKRKRKNDEKPKRGRLMVGDDGELIEEDSYPTPPEPEPGQYPPGGITVSRYSVLPLYSPSDTSNRKGIK